jgi:hypothetical protein
MTTNIDFVIRSAPAPETAEATVLVPLTAWELHQLRFCAAMKHLSYDNQDCGPGLPPHDQRAMARWQALAEKLNALPSPPSATVPTPR